MGKKNGNGKKNGKTHENGNGSKKARVSAEDFVTMWQKSDSIDEVAAKVGKRTNDVSQRATRYRNLGIDLKRFPRGGGGKPLDVAGLKKIANAAAR